jgi:hypothetical protein
LWLSRTLLFAQNNLFKSLAELLQLSAYKSIAMSDIKLSAPSKAICFLFRLRDSMPVCKNRTLDATDISTDDKLCTLKLMLVSTNKRMSPMNIELQAHSHEATELSFSDIKMQALIAVANISLVDLSKPDYIS